MGFNERKSNNNWIIAANLLAADIKSMGFRQDIRHPDFSSMSDDELDALLECTPVSTNNDIIDNIIYNMVNEKQPNLESRKFWRGDIEGCYAMLKVIISVHINMTLIDKPEFFGWNGEDWEETAIGRQLLPTYTDYRIFREAFMCSCWKDMGYLYQRLHGIIHVDGFDGYATVPICKYKFKEEA